MGKFRGGGGISLRKRSSGPYLREASLAFTLRGPDSLDRGTNGAVRRATSERNGTNRGYPENPEADVKSRDYHGRADAVFKGVYVTRRRMCGVEDDRGEERRRRRNGTGVERGGGV